MHNHNDDTIETSDTVLKKKYTSHFIWKVCAWEGVRDRTELQNIDPHSIGHGRVSFPFSWAAQPGTWRSSLSGTCSHSSIFLQLVWSPNWSDLQNCNWTIGGLRAHSAGCWLSLPHLDSNWSGLQTDWFPVFTELYNSSTATLVWVSILHSFNLSTVKVIISWSTGCTCYLHKRISYFDSPAGSEVNI